MDAFRHGSWFAFAAALLGCGAPIDTGRTGPASVRTTPFPQRDVLGVERAHFEMAPQIHQPVWLGRGDQDHGANMGAGVAKQAKLLPRCELRVFQGARHSLAAEVPDALASAIDEFLTRPPDGPPGQDEPSTGR